VPKETVQPSQKDLQFIENKFVPKYEVDAGALDLQHLDDGLTQYINDIRPYLPKKHNTREEDRAMFEAKDYDGLFFSVAMMVVWQAHKHTTDRVAAMDLIQVSNEAIYRSAIPSYNPEKSKFVTWAGWWIWHAQAKELQKNFRPFKVSKEDVLDIKRIAKTGDRKPAAKVAELTGLGITRINYLRGIQNSSLISLNSDQSPERQVENSEILKDPEALEKDSLERHIIFNQMVGSIYEEVENFSNLSKRDRKVFLRRLGVVDGVWTGESPTLDEVGAEIGITRERVRQIQLKALNLIKNPELQDILHDYLYPKDTPRVKSRFR
jgi:RNA polymerase primary sigma factor